MMENMARLLEEKYGLILQSRENMVFSFPAADLTNDELLKGIHSRYTSLIKGTESAFGEVYIAGWFRSPMIALLHLLSEYNQALDLSLGNMTVQIYEEEYNGKLFMTTSLWLHNAELEDGPSIESERNECWTREKVRHFFENTVRPVFEAIERIGTQKSAMLWGQLPTSLQYGYDLLSGALTEEQLKGSLARNLGVFKTLQGEHFGRSRNPLDVKFRYTESIGDPNKQARMKNSCCLYYQIEDGNYCFTCPRLKEEERDRRRAEYREAQHV